MKIVYMIKSLSKGGAERVISNLANYSISKGDEAYIFILEDRKIEYKLDSKVQIISCQNKDKKKSIKGPLNKIICFKNWVKTMQHKLCEVNPDIILSFLPQVNFVSLMANKGRYPIIISARNDYRIEFPNKVYQFMMKRLYPKTDGFIFQTKDQKEYFDNVGITKPYAVIPNPINDNFLIDIYNGDREKSIVSVGRLTEQKNQKLLIDSFNEISKKYNDYTLTIYGEGKLRDSLNEYVKNLNLEDKVILAGNVDNVPEKIYKSSVFVLSSDYEGMPNALMEAMALGIPCVSTNCPCGGPKTLIENNRNGLLVDVGNQEQMVEAIDKILSNKDFSVKISQKASSDIRKKYNANSTYNNYFEFFKKIIKEK